MDLGVLGNSSVVSGTISHYADVMVGWLLRLLFGPNCSPIKPTHIYNHMFVRTTLIHATQQTTTLTTFHLSRCPQVEEGTSDGVVFVLWIIFALCVLYTSKSKYTQSHWIRDVLHSSYYMTMLYGNEGIVGYWSLAQGSGSSTIALCLEAAAKQVVRFRGIGQHWTVYMETLLPSVMVERVLHDEWSVLWYGGVVNLDNEGWFTLLHSTL